MREKLWPKLTTDASVAISLWGQCGKYIIGTGNAITTDQATCEFYVPLVIKKYTMHAE